MPKQRKKSEKLRITFKLLNKMTQKLKILPKFTMIPTKSQNVIKKHMVSTKIAKTTLQYRHNRL